MGGYIKCVKRCLWSDGKLLSRSNVWNKTMTSCCVIIFFWFYCQWTHLSSSSVQTGSHSQAHHYKNHTCSGRPQNTHARTHTHGQTHTPAHTHTHTHTHTTHGQTCTMNYVHICTNNGKIPSTAEWRPICQFLINSFVRLLKRMRNSINFIKWNNNGPNQNKWIHKTTSLLFIAKTHFSNLVWCVPISMGWPVIPS